MDPSELLLNMICNRNKNSLIIQISWLRYTHNEKRYHSEVRQEAVQQALAAINLDKQSKNALVVPMPSKRSSVMQRSSQHDKVRHLITSEASLNSTIE